MSTLAVYNGSNSESTNQTFLDYIGRTDGQPSYMGYAPRGVLTSEAGWLLYKYTYNVSGYMTIKQVAYDSWDNREVAVYA